MPYEYIDYEKMYFSPNEPKDKDAIKREKIVALLVFMVLVGLAVGLPLMVNIGRTLFEIQPVIY